MEEGTLYKLFAKRSNWLLHMAYWSIAAFIMFGLFINPSVDLQVRIALVVFLILVSFFTAQFINKYLVHRFLFKGKAFLFVYLLFAVFIVTFWMATLSVILIIAYSIFRLPNLIIPARLDIAILVTGNFLAVIIAVVIHFVKESYRRFLEKNFVEKQKQQTELKLKEASLKLLQGQIHPHFLFNMLNNLYGLVKEDTESSREVIVKLSDLLDYMLYECDKPFVPLNKEIKFIKDYIELERIRHDDFNVKYDFVENQDEVIAPLILFPFVENAFKHGFNSTENNFIDLKIHIMNGKVIFRIVNSVADINKDKFLIQEGRGIGIKNSKERLELVYKEKYNLDIINENDRFEVNLEIIVNGTER